MNLDAHGHSCYYKGFLDEAEGHLLKGADYCERINLFAWQAFASLWLGETYFDRGEYQKSQDYYSKGISLLEQGRLWPSPMNLGKIGSARTKVMNNKKDIDLESLHRYEAENKAKQHDGLMARYISEILLNIDDQHMSER